MSRVLLISCILAPALVGCGGPWEKFYQQNPHYKRNQLAPTQTVSIRLLDMERLERFAQEEQQRRVNSNVAYEDMSEADLTTLRTRAMETFQLPETGDTATVIGWSEFTFTKPLDPKGGELERFAKRRGADYVVVATKYLGRTQQTVVRPIFTYSQASASGFAYDNYGGYARGYASGTGTSTTWVPMQVAVDQYVYRAVFVRKNRASTP